MSDHLAAVVLADAAVWAGWSAVVGYVATRIPRSSLDEDRWLTKARRWERGGRCYERVGIRRWKGHLPEAGAAFRRGVSKRTLPSRSTEDLRRFSAETRRAELVHWTIPLVLPVFALWNPPGLLAAMAAYAVLANLPCIAIQRYNRERIERILRRRTGARP